MKLLKKLYLIHSPSRSELRMSRFIQRTLIKMGIQDFNVDSNNQIYRLIPDTPLISAHMDQVPMSKKLKNVETVRKKGRTIIVGDGNLGADDKNGVWILLKILEKMKNKISFIFSTEEEVGGNIRELLKDNEKIVKKLKYAIVFDRRNSGDIIGTLNYYCTEKFQDKLKEIGKKYKFKSARGTVSDANPISEYISCVNLSCGYYEPHTNKEYTVFEELINSLKFGIDILKNINIKFDKPEKRQYSYNTWHNSVYNINNRYSHNDHLGYYNYNDENFLNRKYINKSKEKDWVYDVKAQNYKFKRENKQSQSIKEINIETQIYYCTNCNSYFEPEDIGTYELCLLCSENVEIVKRPNSYKEETEQEIGICMDCKTTFVDVTEGKCIICSGLIIMIKEH